MRACCPSTCIIRGGHGYITGFANEQEKAEAKVKHGQNVLIKNVASDAKVNLASERHDIMLASSATWNALPTHLSHNQPESVSDDTRRAIGIGRIACYIWPKRWPRVSLFSHSRNEDTNRKCRVMPLQGRR